MFGYFTNKQQILGKNKVKNKLMFNKQWIMGQCLT